MYNIGNDAHAGIQKSTQVVNFKSNILSYSGGKKKWNKSSRVKFQASQVITWFRQVLSQVNLAHHNLYWNDDKILFHWPLDENCIFISKN